MLDQQTGYRLRTMAFDLLKRQEFRGTIYATGQSTIHGSTQPGQLEGYLRPLLIDAQAMPYKCAADQGGLN